MPKQEVRYVNGYRCVLEPNHPSAMTSANWAGYVYEHILVVEQDLGRSLQPDEHVHHLDGNCLNNRIENLLVLSPGQHTKLEMWIRKVRQYLPPIDQSPLAVCACCGRTLQHKQKSYCSYECRNIARRRTVRPSLAELQKDLSSLPMNRIGKKYEVSGNTVKKWAQQYGLL